MDPLHLIKRIITGLSVCFLLPVVVYALRRNRTDFWAFPAHSQLVALQGAEVLSSALTIGLAWSGRNTHGIANIVEPFFFAWTLWLFQRWTVSPGARRIYGTLMGLGLLLGVTGMFVNRTIFTFNELFLTAQCVILASASGFELYKLASSTPRMLSETPWFWIYAGLLISSLGSLTLAASSTYFLRTLPRALLGIPWLVHMLTICAQKAFIARSFLCQKPASF